MAVATTAVIGMAETEVIRGNGAFTCLGLGSCIGLFMLDPVSNVGGMAHIMLPEAFADRPVDRPGKFADTGVPALVDEMIKAGASKTRLVAAIAGGAQVFQFSNGNLGGRLDIGSRNTTAVMEMLQKLGVPLRASDVGGSLGRTVTATIESGVVKVRTVTQSERLLVNLRG